VSYYPPPSQPPQPSAAPYPPTDRSQQIDGFAIAALVLGILGGVLFSVAFGITALVRISNGKRSGKGLAIAGLCVSAAWVCVFVVLIGLAVIHSPSARDSAGAVTRPGTRPLTDLRIGDCVRLPADLHVDISSLVVVPCAQLHNSQVFTTVAASDRDFYPGEAAVRDGSLDRCQQQVSTFLGQHGAGLRIVALYPTEPMWETATKLSTCLLLDDKGDFTGDVRDHP
jgi:hypothetical protein